MNDLESLKKARVRAITSYQNYLEGLQNEPETFAQKANDAWLEVKRLDHEIENTAFYKKFGELYGG